ncbi:linear gramicidin synthase subunit D [Clostridium puniceum]|uniref:Linear gramicidin synthase subunit D n=1 Tax=Clostridium puniceum TaxID=29367 RepID=A0A1S8T7N5_9CLOT|nr:non-ribosomal peptide synthetase [Clostridium puniceum]OOM73634.1 linear gramicidin synthase subunit D [Clostridium puniceum]
MFTEYNEITRNNEYEFMSELLLINQDETEVDLLLKRININLTDLFLIALGHYQSFIFDTSAASLYLINDNNEEKNLKIVVNQDENIETICKQFTSLNMITMFTLKKESKIFLEDIQVELINKNDKVEIKCFYNFAENNENISLIMSRIAHLLQIYLNNIGVMVGECSFLSDEEKYLVKEKFNDTKKDYVSDRTIVEVFEEISGKNPQKVAAKFQDKEITYGELNCKANAVAEIIRKETKGSNAIVGIMIPRSIDSLIAIIGILKAGSAFLPLDLKQPSDRINYIIKDSGIRLLIKSINEGNSGKEYEDKVKVYELDIDALTLKDNLIHKPKFNDLSYVIYTSGTTGSPKGVLIEHGNLINFSMWIADIGKMNVNTKVLQIFSIIFDASIFEMMPCLISGGTIVILNDVEKTDPQQLLNYLEDAQTLMIPTFFKAVVDYAEATNQLDKLKKFQKVYLGAEAIPADLMIKIKEICPSKISEIVNLYGPTECTVACSAYFYNEDSNVADVTIGSPIKNSEIYIVKNNHLCGIGMKGELVIGGHGVGRGYMNNPSLTEELFIQSREFSKSILYRSGDIGYWRSDGTIKLLGRNDEQVKINGYRVELSEIEVELRKINGIRDSLVMYKDDCNGVFFAAFYTGEEYDAVHLKQQMKNSLPNYMIPYEFHRVNEFPTTIGGKTDKNKLIVDYRAVNTSNSKNAILNIFSSILGKNNLNIENDFFELGGDSIKAITIVSKLRQTGFVLTVRDIMENKKLSLIISKIKNDDDNVKCEQNEITGNFILSPIQRVFFEKMRINNRNYFNQSYMLETEENIDMTAVAYSMNMITKHHDHLRSAYLKNDQIILPYEENKHFEIKVYNLKNVNLLCELEKEIITKTEEIQSGICIENGPLFKVGIFNCYKKNYLFFCLHHLCVDGVSWRILIDDFLQCYTDYLKGKATVLPRKTISFKDWSNYLQEYGRSEELEKEIPYWIDVNSKIQGGKFSERKISNNFTLDAMTFEMDSENTNNLLFHVSKAFNTEINDILLSALARAVSKQTMNKTVAINLEGHGREPIHRPAHNDRTVGWFTTEYPIVLENIGDSVFKDLINVKETIRKIPNRGMGYIVLQDVFSKKFIDIDPDITFNYLGEFGQEENYGFLISEMQHSKDKSLNNAFRTPITINSKIVNKIYRNEVTYESNIFNKNFISDLMKHFEYELKNIISFCMQQAKNYKTPSDFNEMDWSFDDFHEIQKKYEKKNLNIKAINSLTSLQEAMLFQKLENPESTANVVQIDIDVNKKIDPRILKESFKVVCKKYGVLSSRIAYHNLEAPKQLIFSNNEIEHEEIDFSIYEDAIERFNSLKREDIKRGFNFEKDSLFRVKLIKLSENNFKLIITFHHIIIDGWSSQVVINEVFSTYSKLGKNKYVENSVDDNTQGIYGNYIKKYDLKKAKDFWMNLLEGFEEQSSIKAEGMPDGGVTEEVSLIKMGISKELNDRIELYPSKYGYTLNTILEATWSLILSEYSGNSDLVFGKVVSGRNVDIKNINKSVGMFINTLPIRVQLSSCKKIKDLLEIIHNQSIAINGNELYPLDEIQQHTPLKSELIKTAISFENYSNDTRLKDYTIDYIREMPTFPISIGAKYTDTLNLSIMYDKNIYGKSEISRILKRIIYVLEQVLEDPEKNISDIDYLVGDEHRKVLIDFNKTEKNYSLNQSVIDVFEKQVLNTPNNIAVEYENSRLTYEELNKKANYLAKILLERGTAKNSIIPIITKPSLELVIAVIAVLKAGAAYLPVDPDLPIERIKFMIKESNSNLVICGSVAYNFNKKALGCHYVTVSDFLQEEADNLKQLIEPTDSVYIIFTSGTTGKPKGVVINHKNLLNHTFWQIENGNFNLNSTMLQTIAFTFDGHAAEIYPVLLSGGKLLIATEDQRKDPKELLQLLSGKYVTFIPSLLREVISYAEQTNQMDKLRKFDKMFIPAEPITKNEVLKIVGNKNEKLNDIFHFYGPSEATITTVYHCLSELSRGNVEPIGKPIANTKLYVLNKHLKPCGVGIPGELCISGESVSKGYFNRDDLTKEKFINDSVCNGKLMYRTGDIVRWTEEGIVEFLGRKDDQIKLRGFRIEIQEIVSILKEFDEISDAVVFLREIENDKLLCAYILGSKAINISSLKEKILKKLPEYMIPQYIMQIDKMPVTMNGKIDKNKLPMPKIELFKEYEGPKNDVQHMLVDMFKKVLNVDKVSINDSFYDLGGHSLKLTRLLNFIEREFGVRLKIRDIVEAKTVKKISLLLEKTKSENIYENIIAATPLE